jgi:ribosomal protein L28
MSYKCDACEKGSMRTTKGKHRPGKSSKKFRYRAQKVIRVLKPNLHNAKIQINGGTQRVRLCTKCLRTITTQEAEVANS